MAKRVYNDDKTSYADYDDKGRQVGAGLAGAENLSTNGGIMQLGSKTRSGSSSSGGSGGGSGGVQSEIERLRQAQTDAAIASLGKARDSSLSNLSAERAKIEPLYYGKRNAASTGSQLGAKNFAEYMASRGGTSSGTNAQAELSRQGALQGNVGSLNRDEATAFTENDRRVSNVNNAYESDVASAQANAYTQYLQNMINQMNADRTFNQANQQFNMNYGLQQDQFGLQKDQYQSGLDQWDKSFGLQQDQYNTGIEQWDQNFDAQQQQREFDEWLARQQLALSQQNAARARSGGGSSGGMTATQLKNLYTSEAYNDIQSALDKGTSPEVVKQNLLSKGPEYAEMGVNINTLLSHVDSIAKSWGTYEDDEGNNIPKENPAVTTSKANSAWYSLNNMWNR